MTNPCTLEEGRGLIGKGLASLTAAEFARLRTMSDEDLVRLSNSADFFTVSETYRRLTLALQREARRTTLLTLGVFVLTAALVLLTAVLTPWPVARAVNTGATMFDIANPVVHWGYLGLSVAGSLAYGFGAFAAFGVDPNPRHGAWLHQIWFNLVGAAVGWLAGWVVLVRWLSCARFACHDEPMFSTIVLLVVAFVGITGHLPLTIAKGLDGLSALMGWFAPHPPT
jgi:hypothetical protein